MLCDCMINTLLLRHKSHTTRNSCTHTHKQDKSHISSYTHKAKQKQSFLAAIEWSHAPGDPGHLCTKQAHRAGAVQSPGARARSSQEY